MNINIDLDDYIGSIPSSYLEQELIRRDEQYLKDTKERVLTFDNMGKKFSKGERQAFIISLLNLNQHHDTDDIVSAIRELFTIKYTNKSDVNL
jgi:hypothetical protein